MARTNTIARWSRWALVAAAVLMGGALLATVWTTRRSVRGASETLERGQADAIEDEIRIQLADQAGPPTSDDLARIVDDLSDEGLRYLALLDEGGTTIAADAGTPATPRASLARAIASAPANAPVEVRGVLRVVVRRAFRRRGRRLSPRGRARPIVIEFTPRVADQLRASSQTTLAVGALAAGGLLLVALVFFRFVLHREALERALEQDRRLASLGRMSAILAHEMRNPLASLKGNAQLLAMALPEGDRARAKADRVVGEAIRLETLTNDLLEFVRTGVLRREPVEPAAVLREAIAALPEPPPGERAIAPEMDAGAAPSSWPLDRDRMRQVLANLLDNARGAATSRVTARVALEGGRLIYTVRDDGPGIPEADLERVFEPFFTRKNDGTGLGLALAKRVVDLHGGTIAAHNLPGGGAELRVELPRA